MFIIYVVRSYRRVFQRFLLGCNWSRHGAIGIALSYPHRVRVRATVKLSATFFHDESSTTKQGYESAIALYSVSSYLVLVSYLFYGMVWLTYFDYNLFCSLFCSACFSFLYSLSSQEYRKLKQAEQKRTEQIIIKREKISAHT